MALNLEKLKKDIEREFKESATKLMSSITKSELELIGNAAVDEMKKLIAKGVSPIANQGRFPAYKWVGRTNAGLKALRGTSGPERKTKRKQLNTQKNNHYPYSVKGKFPGKRERPVNLELSGKFLSKISVKVTQALGLKRKIEIGFFDDYGSKLESGHREGVHQQPKRPIIPISSEELNPSVYRRIVDTIFSVLKAKVSKK